MLPRFFVKTVNSLPSSIMKPISKCIVDVILNKYANIIVNNREELDKINGPVLFVANHLSNSDGLVLNKVLKRISPYFVAGIKLSENSISRIGVEALNTIQIHPNTADIDAMRKCIDKIKEGNSVLIFPEGTRSRDGSLIEGKKGVLLIAKKCGVPIVPIGISGTEKLMPINDKDMGKEGFYKSDVVLNIGKPFLIPEKEEGEGKEEYHQRGINTIMRNIAALIPEGYRGIYK